MAPVSAPRSLLRREYGWLAAFAFVLLCNGVGFLSVFVANEPEFYLALQRPSFAPPTWVFAPVWSTLYTMMGIAAYLVWREGPSARRRTALIVFAMQLALNAAWTPVFFGAHAIGPALVVIGLIDLAVCAMAITFWRVRQAAGVLVLPLLAWVGFATVLNAAIVALNP